MLIEYILYIEVLNRHRTTYSGIILAPALSFQFRHWHALKEECIPFCFVCGRVELCKNCLTVSSCRSLTLQARDFSVLGEARQHWAIGTFPSPLCRFLFCTFFAQFSGSRLRLRGLFDDETASEYSFNSLKSSIIINNKQCSHVTRQSRSIGYWT